MKSKKLFYETMQEMAKSLAKNPEIKDRYEHARYGGKKWLCLSHWIAEDRTRWSDKDAMAYRDSLASWLGSIDIVYVLQFETDAEIVEYLKERLVAAVERETTQERLHSRSTILEKGLHNPWRGPAGLTTTSQAAAQSGCGCDMRGRFYSAMKGYADYLRGNAPGPSFWMHPDCPLYLKWYNKYDAPTSGLYRAQ